MEEEHPEAAREIEKEIRAANEQLARIEIAKEAGRTPDVAPPRLPEGFIPPHIRGMSEQGLRDFLDRRTRDLEHAQSGWQRTETER
ncbi:hypothetical protein [Halorussus salinisoli]|uniref:hypothetical protein n=1 Tax=Halorussus salinisoli TaxID=2558242 RepID=UPI0010C20C55|nr:hypothetical protein [Halorussus salinisoli]